MSESSWFCFVSLDWLVNCCAVVELNRRATSIAMECGLNVQVLGDAFIGKQFDDDNGFRRYDFTIEDLSTSLPWFKAAKQLNVSRTVCF